MKISFNLYADLFRWKEIYQLNKSKLSQGHEKLSSGMRLRVYRPGTVVISRNGEPYLIRRRDTLSKISSGIYGTTSKWRRLWKNNLQLIHDPNRIYAGFYLYYTLDNEEQKARTARRLASEAAPSVTVPAPTAPTEPASKPVADSAPSEPETKPEAAEAPAPKALKMAKSTSPTVPVPTPPLSQFVPPTTAPITGPAPAGK